MVLLLFRKGDSWGLGFVKFRMFRVWTLFWGGFVGVFRGFGYIFRFFLRVFVLVFLS